MKKKITLLLAFSIIFPVLLFGQGETSNWYFGNNAGIRFNNDGSITPVTDGQLDTFEGCATISDALGDLLFYTDGIYVYDRNHNLMQNGSGLYGDPSSTQSALIIPKPNDPNIFYVFTVDTTTFENDPDNGLNYSVVDISLNNGNGAVTQKNIRLLNDCSEKIAAVVKDCSDKSVWVVTLASQDGNGTIFNTYHAFEVNTSGVSTTAVKSTFLNLDIEDPRGYLKFSNDGMKMASANMLFGLHLYDFDAATGVLSNFSPLSINGIDDNPYGIEFSPNNQFLYTHSSNFVQNGGGHTSSLIQYDLTEADISASQVILDNSQIYRGALQLGGNGKIYRTIALNYFTGTPFLGVINNPNGKGQTAAYQHNAIALGNNATQGLPPFIQSYFNKTDLIIRADGSSSSSLTLCEGEPFTLDAEDIPGATYNWQKDGNVIANPDRNIFHIDQAMNIDSGRYNLEIIPPNPQDCSIFGEAQINIQAIPGNTTLSIIQCDADSGNMVDGVTTINLEEAVKTSPFKYLFFESIVDRDMDNPIANPKEYQNTNPFDQTIFYTVSNVANCKNHGEIEIHINPITFVDDPWNTLYVCDSDPNDAILSGTFNLHDFTQRFYPDKQIEFYQGLDDSSIEQNPLSENFYSEPGLIYARVETDNECLEILRLNLVVNPTPIFELENTYQICTDNPNLRINAPDGFDTYEWFKKDSNSTHPISSSQIIDILEIGEYRLEVGHVYNSIAVNSICKNSFVFKVVPSNRAIIESVIVNDISQNNTVQIEVSGDGEYEYSIDDISYFDSNLLDNVAAGLITVYVRDKKGCGVTQKMVSVLGYPKFFTPNGDGFNDNWKLIGVGDDSHLNSSIVIFDRFGKKLAEIKAGDEGWDGVYNSRPLPSADYWFKINLEDGRRIKGHFALKR